MTIRPAPHHGPESVVGTGPLRGERPKGENRPAVSILEFFAVTEPIFSTAIHLSTPRESYQSEEADSTKAGKDYTGSSLAKVGDVVNEETVGPEDKRQKRTLSYDTFRHEQVDQIDEELLWIYLSFVYEGYFSDARTTSSKAPSIFIKDASKEFSLDSTSTGIRLLDKVT
ncbi:uncharacterized protein LOC112127044 [Cimex lectularius]|uniref:Uncharacterized protein n=1 Tax=Cimex lectularius TaxID=79782 RepID=A0A8I6SIE8_CIMLE|nr:uncharacterized protein LOC112127044 [Cimex lectularius]